MQASFVVRRMKKRKTLCPSLSLLLIFFLIFVQKTGVAARMSSISELFVYSWLFLGPIHTPLPAFHNSAEKGFNIEDLLVFDEIDHQTFLPKAGESFTWHDGSIKEWQIIGTENEEIQIHTDTAGPSLSYLATYIDTKRYVRGKIHVVSPQPFRIYLDGNLVKTKSKTNSGSKDDTSTDVYLETGVHCLLIKSIRPESENSDWKISTSLEFNSREGHAEPKFTLSPKKNMTIAQLLDSTQVTNASISPDGSLAAIVLRDSLPPSDNSESWIELYWVKSNRLYRTFRGGTNISGLNWAASGKKFSYTTQNRGRGTIWSVDIDTGQSFPLLRDIQNLRSHTWSPEGNFIIYSVQEEGAEDRPGVKRIQNIADRQPGWRSKNHLYKANVQSGARQRLTTGELSVSLNSISPDGKKILFTRSVIDYTERPYSKTELYTLDLQSLETELLWQGFWFNNAQWSPEGDRLLILGGPSTFGPTGVDVISGTVPNEYDTQAYLFNLADKSIDPISYKFNPAINRGIWSKTEQCIYFTTNDRSYIHLFRYDLTEKSFAFIDCGVEVIGAFSLAAEDSTAVYTGSSATVPTKSFIIDLQSREYRILCDPSQNDYSETVFGEVKDWTFKNKNGVPIEGRVYYPPQFNPNDQYPCIVNYYGGTYPVWRGFGGRFPLNLWAAQGYIVYVLQPSGATGFGQKFSAAHVNDWGFLVVEEIIEGVTKLLQVHPFIDSKHVGCIGASYGGFITMLLLTKTNIFTSAVSHAGISSISSYWGEGHWGYAYSAYAAANSFPWNRKDIYINQSPLFSADRISTPLLLLHGSQDTNVPPGESVQLFTALKLLGREVEYIRIEEQDHSISNYSKRILWTKSIMAWLDRWLKGEPEWWDDLYPKRGGK
jgi:dipeptidyl aminopeptidase/acylaminoacyl peptidase